MNVLEVIATSVDDIMQLNDTQIDRIEFCSNIQEDGLTPTKEVIQVALKVTKKPINVMVRNSNSFILSNEEQNNLIEYIKFLSKLKEEFTLLNGIVVGYYTVDNKLNEQFLKEVNKVKGNLKITFHKAVDNLIENQEYKKLKDYNISTILTQGGKGIIENNIAQILKLKEQLPSVEILLGGGINEDNIEELIKLNCSIHLGSLARIDKSYNKGYNILYLNKIKSTM